MTLRTDTLRSSATNVSTATRLSGFSGQLEENLAVRLMHLGRHGMAVLSFFFEVNDMTDPVKQRVHLLTLCGAKTYDLVCPLMQPKTPDQVKYADVVQSLQVHFDSRLSEVYSRAMLHCRDQLPGGSVSDCVTVLRNLASRCNFGTLPVVMATTVDGATLTTTAATTTVANPTLLLLDVMLHDKFMSGLRDEKLQQWLFTECDLTFSKAFDFAVSTESAVEQQHRMRTEHVDVSKATTNTGFGSDSPRSCRFETATCHYCWKKGRIEKA